MQPNASGTAHQGDVDIHWESLGDPSGPPVVLIMGLTGQMIWWPEGFLHGLLAEGFHVIRFDNRDTGLSTKLHGAGVPDTRRALLRRLLGLPVEAPYTLSDMARDTVAVLDALAVPAAHLVGISLGGMIAQTVAIEFPERVCSLTSLMSTTGDRRFMLGKPRAVKNLFRSPGRTRAQAVASGLAAHRVLCGHGFPFEERRLRGVLERSYDRCYYPRGGARQLTAVLASGSRTRALRRLRVPSLVIHGDDDPLIPCAAGRATARALRGSRLRVFDGLGHHLARRLWPAFVAEIARLVRMAPVGVA